jgi:hypothetical protein
VSESDTQWVTAETGGGFGTVTDQDEFLHGTGPEGDSLTETWYWGFNVPQARINCYVYCWVHPNLEVVSAGLFIYRGIKRQHLAAELFDLPAFLSAKVIGDGSDIQLPNGMRMQVLDPLRHIHMTYADPGRDTEVDVHLTAVTAPIVRANSKHFEQVMRTRGDLMLRGERYEVDSFNVRDRSWGELRPETHAASPPYNWVTGVIESGDLAFNVGALDDPDHDPHWLEQYPISADQAFKDGWIWRDRRPLRLAHASKRVERETDSLRPTRIEIDMRDTDGEQLQIVGTPVAGLPWGGWHNVTCHLALVRWELDDQLAWGESMDVQWNDYVWRYGGRSD